MSERDPDPLTAGGPVDGPRPLPEGLRDRLEDALLEAADADPIGSLPWAELARPRPLPAATRTGIESSLVALHRRNRWRRPRVIGAAAAALLLVGVAVLAAGDRDSADPLVASPTTAQPSSQFSTSDSAGAPNAVDAAQPTPAGDAATGPGASASGAGSAGAAATAFALAGDGPPPPFASGPDRRSSSAAATGGPRPSPKPALRVGVVGGDSLVERGFRTYVELLNEEGGVSGRPVVLVDVGPGRSASGTVATVNLSGAAIASSAGVPAWVTPPLLEGLSATESFLRGDVYSFAGPVERQSRLAADATYPSAAAGDTAVVYREEAGVFATVVPDAIRGVLTARGVTVIESVYRGGDPAQVPGADAVLLSLDRARAAEWLRAARASGFAVPGRGVTGLHTMFEPNAAANAPTGNRVLSPYSLATGEEAEVLRAGLDEPPGAAATHGWATAKSLAVALWRSGATTGPATAGALDRMTGYSSGLAPPYEVRPSTHSRTPEAAPFEATGGSFVQTGEFRRDRN